MAIVVNKTPKDETLTPAPDGVTVDFQTSVNYVPNSVSIWLNGQKLDPALDDGFTEQGGNTIRMKEPPLTGDTVQGQFDPI